MATSSTTTSATLARASSSTYFDAVGPGSDSSTRASTIASRTVGSTRRSVAPLAAGPASGMELPPLYFGGASPAAEAVAAEQVDVYLLWGEPPAWVADRVANMTALAAARGRSMRFGIRLHVIARERESEAWAIAERLLSDMPQEQIEIAQKRFARQESVGQQRMVSLHNGKLDMEALTVAPNLWAGIGLVRGGAGTALVGSYDQVADRIREYAALGLDTFILSGYPHLEEAYVVGEEIIPRLRGVTAAVPRAASTRA